MAERRVTWNWVRRVYLGVGLLATVGAVLQFVWPGVPGPIVSTLVAILLLGVALFASDELFQRVHRILWRREWPK